LTELPVYQHIKAYHLHSAKGCVYAVRKCTCYQQCCARA